jgi:hypothetical protein
MHQSQPRALGCQDFGDHAAFADAGTCATRHGFELRIARTRGVHEALR